MCEPQSSGNGIDTDAGLSSAEVGYPLARGAVPVPGCGTRAGALLRSGAGGGELGQRRLLVWSPVGKTGKTMIFGTNFVALLFFGSIETLG